MKEYTVEDMERWVEVVEAESPEEAAAIVATRYRESGVEVHEFEYDPIRSFYDIYEDGELVDTYTVREYTAP